MTERFSRLSAVARPASRFRRRSRPRAVAIAACAAGLAASGVTAGCGGESGTSTSSGAGGSGGAKAVLTIGVSAAPASLDPAKDGYDTQSMMRYLSNDTITRFNQDGSIGPGLATTFGYVGEGNKTFEFMLRRDAHFSDGTPVTADAVKAWLDYFAKAGGPFAEGLGLESTEAVDRWTVRLHLRSSNPTVPMTLSGNTNWGFVSGPEALAKPKSLGSTTDGAGPYVLDSSESVAGDHYTFVPNKFYYDKSRVRFGKVVVKVITSPSTMLKAVQSGQVDVATGDPLTAKPAEDAGLTVTSAPSGVSGLILLDRGGKLSKPLADVRVRQALNYAIDRRSITTALMGKYGVPTSEFENGDGHDPENVDYYSYDPAKARALLAEAGYADGFTLDVVEKGWIGNLGTPTTQAMAKYLGEVGVKLKVTTAASYAEYLKVLFGGRVTAVQTAWGRGIMYTDYGLLLAPRAVINPYGWNDPVLDRTYAKAIVAPQDEVADYWRQMSRRIVTQADFVPAYVYPYLVYSSDKVGGVSLTEYSLFAPIVTEWFPK